MRRAFDGRLRRALVCLRSKRVPAAKDCQEFTVLSGAGVSSVLSSPSQQVKGQIRWTSPRQLTAVAALRSRHMR